MVHLTRKHVLGAGGGTSTDHDILVYDYYQPFDSAWGYAGITDKENGCFISGEIKFNTAPLASFKHKVKVAAHEFGHILNLDHADFIDIMKQGTDPTDAHVIHPSYRALQSITFLYGWAGSSFWSESLSGNAEIVRTNNSPTLLWSSNGHAFAYDAHSPSWWHTGHTASVWVEANALHRFAVGWYDGSDPNNLNTRIIIAELGSSGIRGMVSAPGGGAAPKDLSSTAQTGVDYYLQVNLARWGASDTYRATACAWNADTDAFIACAQWTESELKYSSLPSMMNGALTSWGLGYSDYSPKKGHANAP